ncbi:MAG: hypothetical protein M3041_00035 [Acidobacteriota bacterium]|nr:hypothetical protein [Acidobacteriota bacterium]
MKKKKLGDACNTTVAGTCEAPAVCMSAGQSVDDPTGHKGQCQQAAP